MNIRKRAKGRATALKVAEAIRQHEAHYDQNSYAHECGTPSCIAGFTAWIAAGELETMDLTEDYSVVEMDEEDEPREAVDTGAVGEVARMKLELTAKEAAHMFNGHPYGMSEQAQAGEAIRMLQAYGETNVVEWPARAG